MSKKLESDFISVLFSNTAARSTWFFKACLFSTLYISTFLVSQPAIAESPPLTEMNAGLNDAWYNPETNGQGFFVTVFSDLGVVSLAWFTYDTELPLQDIPSNLGDAGHRWFTALGAIDGNHSTMSIDITSGGIFDNATLVQHTDPAGSDGIIDLTFETCAAGTVTYDIPAIAQQGTVAIQRVADDNIALCEALAAPACTRPDPDISHGVDEPPIVDNATVPVDEVIGGGPGPDGIPPLEFPKFHDDLQAVQLAPFELVAGVKIGDDVRAYPHNILNWHEVVNDEFTISDLPEIVTLSFCPLTGSAMLWESFMESDDATYGTSGLLYNSNLIMYDRETGGLWSQMLEQSIWGENIQRIPDRIQVVETSWGTWQAMYPETTILSEDTGFSRDYDAYPYDNFRQDNRLLFPVNNSNDNRLHRKERVLGINVGESSKVYPIGSFSGDVEVINEQVGDMQVVVTGSFDLNFAVVYNRQLEDCTVLDFQAVQGKLPVVMTDNEGNEWDVFGVAVSGKRTGQRLQKTNSYISYWYAWTGFFPGADIHQ